VSLSALFTYVKRAADVKYSLHICVLARQELLPLTTSRALITQARVVKTNRIHPFRLHLLQVGKLERTAAGELGVTREWLSKVLNGNVTPSEKLYWAMVSFAKGAITMKELLAFKNPSPRHHQKPLKRSGRTSQNRRPDV
jgi:hypothetical protein